MKKFLKDVQIGGDVIGVTVTMDFQPGFKFKSVKTSMTGGDKTGGKKRKAAKKSK